MALPADDDAFVAAFSAGDVAPTDFDHRAHLRIAICALERLPFLEACIAMRDGLGHVARRAGKPALYHETLTIAFMALVAERMENHRRGAWSSLLDAHPELFDRGLVGRHYRSGTLASPAARRRFVMSDAHLETT